MYFCINKMAQVAKFILKKHLHDVDELYMSQIIYLEGLIMLL